MKHKCGENCLGDVHDLSPELLAPEQLKKAKELGIDLELKDFTVTGKI